MSAENSRGVVVADFRGGRSVCIYCASAGSLAVHAGVVDPASVLMTCRGCGAAFFISRAEFERLTYAGAVVLPGHDAGVVRV